MTATALATVRSHLLRCFFTWSGGVVVESPCRCRFQGGEVAFVGYTCRAELCDDVGAATFEGYGQVHVEDRIAVRARGDYAALV